MVIKTGDKIKDEIFKAYQALLRDGIRSGRDASDRELLESAINQAPRYLHIRADELRRRVDYANPEDAKLCAAIRLSVGKRLMSYEVQASCVNALLEDYVRRSPYNLTFQVRRNYTVAIKCVLPSSQVLSVRISFKRVREGGFGEDFEKGVKSLIDFSSNFGKMTIR
ncbi:MAG: hypothetical protein ACI4UJ_08265 [Candidatus Cryptobacteroides sp.]